MKNDGRSTVYQGFSEFVAKSDGKNAKDGLSTERDHGGLVSHSPHSGNRNIFPFFAEPGQGSAVLNTSPLNIFAINHGPRVAGFNQGTWFTGERAVRAASQGLRDGRRPYADRRSRKLSIHQLRTKFIGCRWCGTVAQLAWVCSVRSITGRASTRILSGVWRIILSSWPAISITRALKPLLA
jgi:hypothetical protein